MNIVMYSQRTKTTDAFEHRKHTTSDISVKQPDRRVPPQVISEVRKLLQDWIDDGIITESESPYASQVVQIRKKFGLALTIDSSMNLL